MANVTVCARFRPLSSRERREDDSDDLCIQGLDAESFIFKVCFTNFCVCVCENLSLGIASTFNFCFQFFNVRYIMSIRTYCALTPTHSQRGVGAKYVNNCSNRFIVIAVCVLDCLYCTLIHSHDTNKLVCVCVE